MDCGALVSRLHSGAQSRAGDDALVVQAVKSMASIDDRRAELLANMRSLGGPRVSAAIDALHCPSPFQCARVVLVLARGQGDFERAYESTPPPQPEAGDPLSWDSETCIDRDGILAVSIALAPHPPSSEHCAALSKDATELLALSRNRAALALALSAAVTRVAPNLAAVTGAYVAAELVGAAGSLTDLAHMPANNVVVLGRRSRNAQTPGAGVPHVGVLALGDFAADAPPAHARQAHRMLASKAVLAARFDVSAPGSDGAYGRRLRAEIESRMALLTEPLGRARDKPIPPPETGPRKRRGGRRARKLRERLAPTDVRRRAERLRFGVPEQEVVVGGEIVGLGTLGDDGMDSH